MGEENIFITCKKCITFFHDQPKQTTVGLAVVVTMSPIEITDIFMSLVVGITKLSVLFITVKLR